MGSSIGTLVLISLIMLVVLGMISVLAHIYNLNNIKAKTVGDGQHGTARWARKEELQRAYRHIPYTPEKWRKQASEGKVPTYTVPLVGKKKGEVQGTVGCRNMYSIRKRESR